MMPCNAIADVVSGVTFTKNASGSITVLGTSTEPIEYTIADGKANTIFVLKGNTHYYLNLGGLECELRYFDGETTAQKYVGASGLLNLEEDIEVTQVVVKIPSGESLNTTFYPQLEYGTEFTSYELYKCKKLSIDIGEQIAEIVYPEDTLFAKDTLYPGTTPKMVDYILIEEGKVIISVNQEIAVHSMGRISLYSDYSTVYSDKDVDLELEYSSSILDVDTLEFLQGKSTTTEKFTILKDGSISAKDGYFSGTVNATDGVFKGRIEADSGYFKGTVQWEKIKDENGKEVDEIVTQITRNTITTAYVNALNIKAGSVDAQNIIGDVFLGKKISGGILEGNTISGGTISIGTHFSVDSSGNVTANSLKSSSATITGGKIAGFTIDSNGIRSGKNSFSSTGSGVYIGTDGISVGSFSVSYLGDVNLGSIGDLKLGGTSTISFTGGLISVEDDGVYLGTDRGTHLKMGELKVGGSYSYYTTINQNKITFGSGSSAYLYHGSNALITMNSLSVTMGTSSSSCKVGFFGLSGATKQKIAKISSTYSATASEVATKINALIDALNSYGLISNSSY